jgi:hypothetical protein
LIPSPSARMLTISVGALLVVPAALGLFLPDVPTIFCPLPILTILPALVFSPLAPVVVVIPSLLFFAWNPALFRGVPTPPKRSYMLFGALVALSVVYFVLSWDDGVKYESRSYTQAIALANAIWIALLTVLFVVSRIRKPSFVFNLTLHWLLFAWLAWYAFPYLGELP